MQAHGEFSNLEKEALFKAISQRRDVRSNFLPNEIPEEVLHKILLAGHHAPSVGFLQPWNFIIIRSQETRQHIKHAYQLARKQEADNFDGEKRTLYDSLKLEGILEAPLNICITCDRQRNEDNLLGRSIQPDMDIYSTVCAVQNMWLTARTEGIGMGWGSIIDKKILQEKLKLPESVEPVAYLCLGYVDEFLQKPELEEKGWQQRLKLKDLIKHENWCEEL